MKERISNLLTVMSPEELAGIVIQISDVLSVKVPDDSKFNRRFFIDHIVNYTKTNLKLADKFNTLSSIIQLK